MSKEIYISSTPHETRLAIVEQDELTEIYYERENEYTLAGSIYNGKVTRVLPGMQSSFVDVGLERDAFLYITDFMEEAGDSADFDTGENRGRSNGRRGDRSRDSQGSDTAATGDGHDRSFTEAVEGVSPASDLHRESQAEPRSSDRNGRTDRNDRSRRRGRSGNRDAQPRDSRPLPEPVSPQDFSPEPAAPLQIGSPEPSNEADLGEGAPGADGSRRWRGRRGRRRGRSGNREGLPAGQPGSIAADSDAFAGGPDPSAGYDLPESFDEDELDLDASAESTPSSFGQNVLAEAQDFSQPQPDVAVETSTVDPAPSLHSREGREGVRRDRGGRDRRDDRPRAPRGFAPSRALYGVDDTADQQGTADGPPAEPVILPGESLSKYRQDGDVAQGASATPAAAPSAAPAFVLPGAWDGGNVLPGETLRPRPATSSSSATEPRRDSRREGGRRDDRSDGRRGGRPTPDAEPRASVQVAPVVPFRNEPVPVEHDADGVAVATPRETEATLAEIAPELPSTGSQQPSSTAGDTHQTSAPPAPEPAHTNSTSAEQEYEPTEGAASHRFDPVPPREFRQPASEIEFAAADVSTVDHSITPPAGTPLTPVREEGQQPLPTASLAQTHDLPVSHDLTSITPDGEMLSQPPPPPPEQEIAEPTSPLQHETVILHASAEEQVATEPQTTPASQPRVDAPEISLEADDLIVEELSHELDAEVDEEDFQTITLHAASIEEMEYDDEEETLEGAADLGTMLREMSIDEITQPGEPGADEDEDEFAFEEEDSVEDAAFASSFQGNSERDSMSFTEADFGGEPSGEESDDPDDTPATAGSDAGSQEAQRNDRRRGGRRDGRRGGRDRDRGSDRSRSPVPISSGSTSSTSSSGDRDRSSGSRPGRRDGHRSAQTTNLPAISDLLKPGQEVLVQIAKEPIAKKGARITSHIALPGRFLVFMPTVNHTGVSRKIESDSERRRLKEILLSEKGEASGGFIVRTAASGASEEELRSDLRFLLNLWADIKQRSEASKSPALIYHDLNLVERILRDQVTDNFSAIWVDTESEYERVLRFLQRFQPSLIRRVKLYTKDTPMYEQFGITEEINKALRSKVWLKSGGSIVINQTEALVAIDINTGKYVGKTARLEDTIVKTNLDAIPEIVRQIRLRDLGGIIIIDFIDMDERKNRHKVMAVLEEELKKDRAPSKVLQFNDFGLVAITRKRVKQSLERTLSTTCGICAGTGMVKSAVTVCNDIYMEMRKMQKHLDRGDVMLRVNPEVVKQLKSPSAKWLQEMEEMVGKTILVKSDPTLHPEQFDIH